MENDRNPYQVLKKFIGKWNTEGVINDRKSGYEINVSGIDTYEWLPGGYFLLHKADVSIGEERSETHEIIGFDKHARHYTMQYYNNKGESGTMKAEHRDGKWTFTGEGLRFNGGFKHADNEFSGIWERKQDNGTWDHFMEIRLVRAES